MALNLLDALFRSLNSIKSGNEVCRRVSLARPPSSSHSSRLSFPLPRPPHRHLPLTLPSSPLLTIVRTSRNCRARFNSRFVLGIIEFSARFFAFCAREREGCSRHEVTRRFRSSDRNEPRFRRRTARNSREKSR